MADRTGLAVTVSQADDDRFPITADRDAGLVALVLRRRREACGLSLADVAQRIGAQSRNAYARYEAGTSTPTITKLAALAHAVDPEHDLALTIG